MLYFHFPIVSSHTEIQYRTLLNLSLFSFASLLQPHDLISFHFKTNSEYYWWIHPTFRTAPDNMYADEFKFCYFLIEAHTFINTGANIYFSSFALAIILQTVCTIIFSI